MQFHQNLSMCIICMLLYLTKHICTKHSTTTDNNNNNHNRKSFSKRQSWSTFNSLREVDDESERRTSSRAEMYINQTDRLLEGAKRNLMLSIGVRRNMVRISNQIRMRPLHNYMLYITEMYKNLSRNGLSSLSDEVGGCGMEGTRKRGLGKSYSIHFFWVHLVLILHLLYKNQIICHQPQMFSICSYFNFQRLRG